ncbi:MAG: hypothetical protein AAF907_12630, partial [Planctomycetota bacterium]
IGQGDRFSQGVPKLLETLADKLPDDNDLVKSMTLNVASENGVTWHRFAEPDGESDDGDDLAVRTDVVDGEETIVVEREDDDGVIFFGGKPALHVGLGRKHVWAVLGAEGSLAEAQALVTVVQSNAGRVSATPEAPIRGAVNVSGWFPDTLDDDSDDLLRAREAFADGTDRVTIRFEPTASGGSRMRLVFGEGFIRFLGLSITDQYDRSQL